MIFLSLRFYVKSILGILEVQNLPICNTPRAPNVIEIGRTSRLPKTDFTKNLNALKILNYPHRGSGFFQICISQKIECYFTFARFWCLMSKCNFFLIIKRTGDDMDEANLTLFISKLLQSIQGRYFFEESSIFEKGWVASF